LQFRGGEHGIIAMGDVGDGLASEFAGIEAEECTECGVEAQEAAAAICIDDADRRLVEGVLK
jgi:hypothetical protein